MQLGLCDAAGRRAPMQKWLQHCHKGSEGGNTWEKRYRLVAWCKLVTKKCSHDGHGSIGRTQLRICALYVFFWIITDGYCLVPINDRRLFQFISPAWLKEIRSSSPVFMGKTPWFPVDFPFNQSIDKPWFSLMFSFQSSIQWWMCRQVSLSRTGNLVPGFLWCRHISPYTCDSSGTWSWKNRQILFPRFQRRFFLN